MRIEETQLAGLYQITLEPSRDNRGSFARVFCSKEFTDAGLNTDWPQHNLSHNTHAGVLRGMHYQTAPNAEIKMVRCVRGVVFDVVVDLRSDSDTYRQWHAVELSAANGLALYIPEGFAHGFQTLQADSDLLYLMSRPYQAQSTRGVRWDDPAFDIPWPATQTRIISEKDQGFADFHP